MTVFVEWPMNRIFRCLSSYVLRNVFGERGNYTFSQKIEEWNRFTRERCVLCKPTIRMSLKTQILCGFRLFLIKKTVLEFGDAQHFAVCGCILHLFADSLHRTQSADCRIYHIQDYISKGPTFSFDVYCCVHWIGWRSQRQSEKVNIRNACFLPVRAKCGRFCVLMQGCAWIRTVSYLPFGLQQ